jgi:type IV pilus assembly protein PilE
VGHHTFNHFRERAGFTLLELIIVIVILGILATLGFTQYTKIVEKGRSSEAKVILGQLRTAQLAYYMENGAYFYVDGGLCSSLGVEAPNNCSQTTHYFYYQCGWSNGMIAAKRCTGATGKQPGGPSEYYINIYPDGTLTTNY